MAKKKVPPSQLAGIAPYKFKPGAPSPNPGGRPRQHKEMVAKLREHADWIADAILAMIEKGLHGKLTMSDWNAGKPCSGVTRNRSSSPEGSTLAIIPAPKARRVLPCSSSAPASKTNKGSSRRKIPAAPVLTPAERETTPDGRLPSEREVLENMVGKDRAKELIGEKVIVVDSTGAAIAPPPAPEPAAPEGSTSAEDFSSLAAYAESARIS